MFKNLSVSYILKAFQTTFKRFPIIVILMFLAAMSMQINVMYGAEQFLVQTFVFSTLSSIFILSIYLLREKKELSSKVFYGLIIFSFSWSLYSVSFDYKDFNMVLFFNNILLYVIGFLALSSVPIYFNQNEKKFYFYLNSILMALAVSLGYMVVLAVLSMVGLGTVSTLFDIDLGKLYIYFNIWIFLFFFPLTFISHIKKETSQVLYGMHEKLAKYFLLPAMFIYFLIIVVYLAKIIFQGSWPNGTLSFLILWFISLGFIVLFFFIPMLENEWVKKLRKSFLYLLLPLSFILVFAWFERFDAYGLTIWRYYLILIIFWIFSSSIYLLFSKNKNLQNNLIFLSILGIFSLYGPFSGINMSNKSQVNQIIKLTKENKMLKGECIDKKENLSKEVIFSLSSSLTYLQKHKALSLLDSNLCTKPENMTASVYAKAMGFKLVNRYDRAKSFSYYRDNKNVKVPSAGKIVVFSYYNLNRKLIKNFSLKDDILVYNDGFKTISFDLKDALAKIIQDDILTDKNAKVAGSVKNSFIILDSMYGVDTKVNSYSGHIFIPE